MSLHPGDQLDHYLVEKLVARSGMASIYRAKDVRSDRVVALKIPHPEVESDPLFFDRFRREEEIGKKLDHPGVMKVYEDGERNRVYMVLEWVDGRLLRQILIEQKKLPIERAIHITLGICDALEYIHSQGVVHRDLKPENIMVDANDNIKLIDFGIAGAAGAKRLTFAKLTAAMGTPDYISPEQVKSKRGDARSDVYALGVMLYEMVTGEVPFHGPNAFAIMNDRLLNNPIPPRELNPEVTPELQEIIYRALERNPANRYASAKEFAHDLRHPESVGVADRAELRDWKRRRSPWLKQALFYAFLAMIPVVIFGLMFFFARLNHK
jgi:eukaryotic-like serine/threonine-protein kinase